MPPDILIFAVYYIGFPLIILGATLILTAKLQNHSKIYAVLTILWGLSLLVLLLWISGTFSRTFYWVGFLALNLSVFILPLFLFTLFVVRTKVSRLSLHIIKWAVYGLVASIVSFMFFMLQPGTGLDYDGAMESSDACMRVNSTIFGEREVYDNIHIMDNPKTGFYLIGVENYYWTRGDNIVACRTNHYLRRVTKFRVDGVSKLHLIEKSDREFKNY